MPTGSGWTADSSSRCRTAGTMIQRTRRPFTDEIARALADPGNLARFAGTFDPSDRGIRDIWETIIATGRRSSEVIGLRLDCVGRYGGLPLLWHDQAKVGNYDEAMRIPEYIYQKITGRQRKTLDLFERHHGRPRAPPNAPGWPCFPLSATRTAPGRSAPTRSGPGSASGWTSSTWAPAASPTRPATFSPLSSRVAITLAIVKVQRGAGSACG
jgi:hypothetical protein